ncbi:hypothetical protein SteCoe_24692 [Stentor coeruleus]|uniref:Uncharacterized protein n=1 Tax=Stentor coeruleus TaxID=5963 RepID=A0A1R2BGX0_9CILI|nr:hypothetical protein SteCoe_24692 [Stentor coeruleus]
MQFQKEHQVWIIIFSIQFKLGYYSIPFVYILHDILQKHATKELELATSTVSELFTNFREICSWDLEENPQRLGRIDEEYEPITIEIDTSYFLDIIQQRCLS